MIKILITGASGFIGKNLKEYLECKYDVYAPSSSDLNLLDAVEVKSYLTKYKFDVLLHSATWNATIMSGKDKTLVFKNNLQMFFNLARNNKLFDKMIYYGSGAEYHKKKIIPRVTENFFDEHVPIDDYGFSKYIMRKFAVKAKNIKELCLFGVFGKYEDLRIRFISNACCRVLLNMPITIKQNIFFDYLDVEDLVKVTEWYLLNKTNEKVYNICTGKSIDLLTIAQNILKISNKEVDIIISKKGLGLEYSGDNNRFIKEIGGFNFKEIYSSISDLYAWYGENNHLLEKKDMVLIT